MAAEVDKVPGGWPFGLRSLAFRLWTMVNLQAAATGPRSRHTRSGSFASSSSSSDLDTESTRSFFHERSRTLGSLIGMTSAKESVSVARSMLSEEMECTAMMGLPHDPAEEEGRCSTCCVCVPLIESVLPGRTSTLR